MKIPCMCIDNFFDLPDEVAELANNVSFDKNVHGLSPGLRSEPLEEKFPLLCQYISYKVLAQLYDLKDPITIKKTGTHFMKVPYSSGEGITHFDSATITAITYLTKDISGCGTSVYRRKNLITDHSVQDIRAEHFEKDYETEQWISERDKYNSNFEEIMRVNGIYNTTLVFNGFMPHRMNIDNVSKEGDRLTLIQFIDGVIAPESPEERFEIARGSANI